MCIKPEYNFFHHAEYKYEKIAHLNMHIWEFLYFYKCLRSLPVWNGE
jgi:hypothetical protein